MFPENKGEKPWGFTEDQLLSRFSGNDDGNKNCYEMVRIGLVIQYYEYETACIAKSEANCISSLMLRMLLRGVDSSRIT